MLFQQFLSIGNEIAILIPQSEEIFQKTPRIDEPRVFIVFDHIQLQAAEKRPNQAGDRASRTGPGASRC